MITEAAKKEALIFEQLRKERPNEKQRRFFLSEKKHVAYGGARGGGKSWAMRRKVVMMCMRYDGLKALIVRRTFAELRNNHINPLRLALDGYAVWHEVDKVFSFPNGSTIKLGYCDCDGDLMQYQGAEYDVIGLEEATNLQEDWIRFIRSCLRTTRTDGFRTRVFYTLNPGGPSHMYFKRLFIDRDFLPEEDPSEYDFIQAKVDDNRVLLESDPEYVKMLDALPPGLRAAHRDGDWNLFVGQYFAEFREAIHVIDPIQLPKHWRRYRSIDYGLDRLACYWYAISPDRTIYVYRELCESSLPIYEAAKRIREMTTEDEDIYATLAPTDLWSRSQETGKDKAQLFYENGVTLTKSSNDREAGWLAIKELLKPRAEADGRPTLQIFRVCRELIKYLPALQFDPKRPTDTLVEPHEITHAPDSLRYLCIFFARPNEVEREKPRFVWPKDLLDDYRRGTDEERAMMEKRYGKPW